MNFLVNLDFSDPTAHDQDHLAELIQASVLATLAANGIDAPDVIVSPDWTPKIVVTVGGGVAEIAAVDGVADIALIDYDDLEDGPIDDFKRTLQFCRHEGTGAEVDQQINYAHQKADVTSTLRQP